MARSKNTTFVSMCVSNDEKRILDEAAAADAEKRGEPFNRNQFIRRWIRSLAK